MHTSGDKQRKELRTCAHAQIDGRLLPPPSLSYARGTSIRPPASGPQVGYTL